MVIIYLNTLSGSLTPGLSDHNLSRKRSLGIILVRFSSPYVRHFFLLANCPNISNIVFDCILLVCCSLCHSHIVTLFVNRHCSECAVSYTSINSGWIFHRKGVSLIKGRLYTTN